MAAAPDPSSPDTVLVGAYVRKVEALRKRVDFVSYTMNRVQVRLESLQDAVTRHEAMARKQQQMARSQAAAAAAAAALALAQAAAAAAGGGAAGNDE
jgi:hypothetical protein